MYPKVSIIVPVYGVEKYLDRCVQSLLHQTLKDIEIILVDDKSPDSCPRMCDEYALQDERIHVVHREENGGLGLTRNSGLDVATGKYVAFVDSDDFVEKDTYESLYEECEHLQLDICYFRYRRIDERGNRYEIFHDSEICDFLTKEEVGDVLLGMLGANPSHTDRQVRLSVSVCGALYKRAIIEDNGVRFTSERDMASEDIIFHVNLLPHVSRVRVLPCVFYNYFINGNSISTSYNEQKFWRFIRLLDYLDCKLPCIFPHERYYEHYLSYVLGVMKVILRFESWQTTSLRTRSKRIAYVCGIEQCQPLYTSRYVCRRPIKDRLIIYCMKHRISLFFLFLYKVVYHKYGM